MRIVLAAIFLCAIPLCAADPLLVIALDGFRHDYLEKFDAPNLLALKREGASVERMVPAFPSTTFPNFYSMATGLRPARHGIVAMVFRDPQLDKGFIYWRNASEGFWYGGEPFWETAQKKGKRVAMYFWPGSDAEIHGVRPWRYFKYDSKTTHEARVKQALDWLAMPDGERPDAVVVYFSDADSAGHANGPDSTQARDAVARVDATVGDLVKKARALRRNVNVVVVSDHGMSVVEKRIDFSSDADLSGCRASNEAPMTMLYCRDPQRVYRELTSRTRDYRVYRKGRLPKHLHYEGNRRIGDLVVLPKGNFILTATPPGDDDAKPVPALKGMHGYDPQGNSEMRGMLLGVGPAFREGTRVREALNVDVNPLVLHLMGLEPLRGVDGKFSRVRGLLRQ